MTTKAKELLAEIKPDTKLGDLRKIAKEIKKDHDLALELWESEEFKPRLLAILIMDKKTFRRSLGCSMSRYGNTYL